MLTGTGIGALSAALVIARSGSATQWRRFIATGVAIVAAGLVGLSIVQSRWPAVACCAAIGFGLIMFMATGQSVVQLGARSHNRGRVMAIWAMVLSGAAPAGNFLAGQAADHFGEPVVLRTLGFACGAAAVVLWLLLQLWLRFHSPYRSLETAESE
jgi:MFS family permease